MKATSRSRHPFEEGPQQDRDAMLVYGPHVVHRYGRLL